MARRSRPPLYEYLQSNRPRTAPGETRPARAEPEAPAPSSPIQVGQAIRLPVGYVFLAIAAILLLGVLAYALGSWRGREEAKEEFYTGFPGESLMASDPLAAPGTEDAPTLTMGADVPADAVPERSEPSASTGHVGLGSIRSDPRVSGKHYFCVATTPNPEGARRLAEFCRSEGLEAYIIAGRTASHRQVICLPALESTSPKRPEYIALLEEIRRVGRLWKSKYPAESDLSDAYLISG